MPEIIIYEGTMCCSTGLCGPQPDQEIIEFNEAIEQLAQASIKRVNLSNHFAFFQSKKHILETIQKESTTVFPITTLDDNIVLKGQYPTLEQLKTFVGKVR